MLTRALLRVPPAWGHAAVMSRVCARHSLQGPVLTWPGRRGQRPPALWEPRGDPGMQCGVLQWQGGPTAQKARCRLPRGGRGTPSFTVCGVRPLECEQLDALLFQKAVSGIPPHLQLLVWGRGVSASQSRLPHAPAPNQGCRIQDAGCHGGGSWWIPARGRGGEGGVTGWEGPQRVGQALLGRSEGLGVQSGYVGGRESDPAHRPPGPRRGVLRSPKGVGDPTRFQAARSKCFP